MEDTIEARMKNYVEQAHYLRGKFIHSYSQLEYLSLDIISKVRPLTIYRNVNFNFPQSVQSRVKLLRQLVTLQGPLKAHQDLVEKLCQKLEDHLETRQFLSHGLLSAAKDRNDKFSIKIIRNNPKAENVWKPQTAIYFAEEFQDTIEISCVELNSLLPEVRSLYDRLNFEGSEPLGEFKHLD